jgi:hypothetical protein
MLTSYYHTPKYMPPSHFIGFRVPQYLFFCVLFCRPLHGFFYTFSCGHCIVCGLVSCGHSIVCGLVPPLISKELFLYKTIFHKYHFMTVESAYSQYVPWYCFCHNLGTQNSENSGGIKTTIKKTKYKKKIKFSSEN